MKVLRGFACSEEQAFLEGVAQIHGVMPLRDGYHPLLGNQRINLTFRKAS